MIGLLEDSARSVEMPAVEASERTGAPRFLDDEPPLTAEETAAIASLVAANGTFRSELQVVRRIPHACRGGATRLLYEKFQDRPSNRLDSAPLIWRTGRELNAHTTKPVEWYARPIVPAGGQVLFIGNLKIGKTTLLTSMVHRVTAGLDFLGCPTVMTPVVYLTEQSPSLFKHQCHKGLLHGRLRVPELP
jgi:AAA domain